MKWAILFWLIVVVLLILLGAAAIAREMTNELGVLGSLASIAGGILTIQVALAVYALKEQYTARIMLDSCFRRLRVAQNHLNDGLSTKNRNVIIQQLGPIQSLLEEINLHLPPDGRIKWTREDFAVVIKSDNRQTLRLARDLGASISEWITKVELHIEKSNWRRNDV
ncbi:MAG TPA: hypothetical protein VNQ76_09890 [Planctomicrobium sp.]|nr:hypothetical protein [Planctomicrobium sp.]